MNMQATSAFVRNPAAGAGLALLCLCILGTMPIIANSRPAGFSALGFAFYLSLWQSVFAVPLFWREMRGANRGIFGAGVTADQRRRALLVALATSVMFGLSTYLYVLGVEKAGAVSAAIAMQAYPVFAILWESLFLNRRKSAPELALTALLIVSMYYLGTGGTWRVDGFSPWFLLALGVPFLWSIAHVIIKEELNSTPVTPAQVTFVRVVVSTLFLAVVVALFEPQAFAAGLQGAEFQYFAVLMGFVYYLELIIWFYAARHIDISLASSITTPWPALTMVLAVIFLGDRVELYQIGAFIVVGLCIYGLTFLGTRSKAP